MAKKQSKYEVPVTLAQFLVIAEACLAERKKIGHQTMEEVWKTLTPVGVDWLCDLLPDRLHAIKHPLVYHAGVPYWACVEGPCVACEFRKTASTRTNRVKLFKEHLTLEQVAEMVREAVEEWGDGELRLVDPLLTKIDKKKARAKTSKGAKK